MPFRRCEIKFHCQDVRTVPGRPFCRPGSFLRSGERRSERPRSGADNRLRLPTLITEVSLNSCTQPSHSPVQNSRAPATKSTIKGLSRLAKVRNSVRGVINYIDCHGVVSVHKWHDGKIKRSMEALLDDKTPNKIDITMAVKERFSYGT